MSRDQQPGVLGNLRSCAIDMSRSQGWKRLRTDVNRADPSHWALNNGVLHVPIDDGDTTASSTVRFETLMAYDISRGVAPCWVEVLTPRFRFFLDLDLVTHVPDSLSNTCIREYAQLVQACVRRYYPDLRGDQQTVVVCAAPVKGSEESGFKHGLHLYVPRLIVDRHIALYLREAVVLELERRETEHSTRMYREPFDVMVDDGMFVGASGSLRMQGSDKTFQRDGVWEPVGRVYDPVMVVDHTGQPRADALTRIQGVRGGGADEGNLTKMRALLRVTSVRSCDPLTVGFRLYSGYIPPRRVVREALVKGGGTGKGDTIREGTDAHEAYTDVVRSSFGGVYSEITLLDLQRMSDHRVLARARTGTPGATRCHNLLGGRCHKSSTIFFMLTNTGALYQRCFCTKSDASGRAHGSCREWIRGDPSRGVTGGHRSSKQVSSDVVSRIFGDGVVMNGTGEDPPPKRFRVEACM